MAKFIIKGGANLQGKVKVGGNKNSILPIMAACLLTDKECLLTGVPKIADVKVLGEIIKNLGVSIEGLGMGTLRIQAQNIIKNSLPAHLVKQLRASILFLGPILARYGEITMSYPGGDVIGRRGLGTHFEVAQGFGAKVESRREKLKIKFEDRTAADIFLDEASVTATENALMIASLICGETVIRDAACEPHVEELAFVLKKMGAGILGAGTNVIKIEGVQTLKGFTHEVWPDYIDVGTFAIAAAVTHGHLVVEGVRQDDLAMVLLYLSRFGVKYKLDGSRLELFPSRLVASEEKIQTRPWPGFPTDLMSPLIVLATQADGTTLLHDWMYESRMFFVDKLVSMGAKITICDPHRVLVTGPTLLRGKVLDTPDIRAGMALILAALCAKGESVIHRVELVKRGYEDIVGRFRNLGAKIVEEEDEKA
jgi:UDP-N-acetylglucosamine 1-carboxyvinyltransferase